MRVAGAHALRLSIAVRQLAEHRLRMPVSGVRMLLRLVVCIPAVLALLCFRLEVQSHWGQGILPGASISSDRVAEHFPCVLGASVLLWLCECRDELGRAALRGCPQVQVRLRCMSPAMAACVSLESWFPRARYNQTPSAAQASLTSTLSGIITACADPQKQQVPGLVPWVCMLWRGMGMDR